MNAYFDTSVLVAMVLGEPGAPAAARCWEDADDGFSSEVGYLELLASLTRARRNGRSLAADPGLDRVIADDVWDGLVEIDVDDAAMAEAGRVASVYGLRAFDALHLASALLARGDEPLAFVSFDRELRRAALAEGFVVLPEAA